SGARAPYRSGSGRQAVVTLPAARRPRIRSGSPPVAVLMERRIFLAISLSILVLYAYQVFLAPPPPKTPAGGKPPVTAATSPSDESTTGGTTTSPPAAAAPPDVRSQR